MTKYSYFSQTRSGDEVSQTCMYMINLGLLRFKVERLVCIKSDRHGYTD